MTSHRSAPSVLLAGLVALLLLVPVGAPSYGDTDSRRDPDDVEGRLDLARVSHTHVHHRLVHTIRMQEGWRARVLRKGRLTLWFKSGSRYRTVDVRYRRHRLVARICRDERLEGGELVNCSRNVGIDRPDGRTVTLRGTLKDLAAELGLTHEALYRALAALERSGAIIRGKGKITLVRKRV